MTTVEERTGPPRFRDQTVSFGELGAGRNIEIPSASPVNYHQVISKPAQMPRITIDGKLFMPASGQRASAGKWPLVMIVPGSLGVAPSHVAHAETLTRAGFATFVLDSFGARGVTSTVANQTQFSFAASAYDVLAAWKVLAGLPGIDASRIGAQGHSRGGSAVLTAATRRFADAVIGPGSGLQGVLAAYPWSGHQFRDPGVGATAVRVLMGDADEWCSPMQVQGHCQAIRLAGGDVDDAAGGGGASQLRSRHRDHGCRRRLGLAGGPDRLHRRRRRADPSDPDAPDPALTDRDLMVYALKAGYGRKGAKIGSRDGEAELFRADMLAFWERVLGKPV